VVHWNGFDLFTRVLHAFSKYFLEKPLRENLYRKNEPHFNPTKTPSKNADPTDFHFFIAQLNLPFHFYWWHKCQKKQISITLND
jgi:hypothetical protein